MDTYSTREEQSRSARIPITKSKDGSYIRDKTLSELKDLESVAKEWLGNHKGHPLWLPMLEKLNYIQLIIRIRGFTNDRFEQHAYEYLYYAGRT